MRPAFQMAVDDDVLHKNPFEFELATVIVNDSVTREAVSRDQMRKFLKFIHDDNVYCKYYEVVYVLFHTGMRISEFCGLTLKDIDLEKRIINVDHQLLRTSEMKYVIEVTKTNAGTRKLPITEDVFRCLRCIGNNDSITWSSGITTFTGCRYRTLLPTSAAIPTAAIWRSRA